MAMEEVEGNEGLLVSILVWLPPISVFKFRCVSKRWRNILSERYFIKCYNAGTRSRQIFYGGGRILAFIEEYFSCSGHTISSINNKQPVAQTNVLEIMWIPRNLGWYVSSSNGLILCLKKNHKTSSFNVVNPLTKKWVEVPPYKCSNTSRFGLASEENTSEVTPSFRIVGIAYKKYIQENAMLIETYSSKTGKWTTSTLIGTELLHVQEFEAPRISNCVFHWPTKRHTLAVYDPSEDENHLQLIKLPGESVFGFSTTRSSHDNTIWVGINNWENMKFWKLPKDEKGGYTRMTTIDANEWILMHTVDMQTLCKDAALFLGTKKRKKHDGEAVDYNVSCLDFEAFIPGNPKAVILTNNQRVFRYNLESKSIELVLYRGALGLNHSYYTGYFGRYPYVESLSLSSYCLSGNSYGNFRP